MITIRKVARSLTAVMPDGGQSYVASLRQMFLRCILTVLTVMCISLAISAALSRPETCRSTSRSRSVSGSRRPRARSAAGSVGHPDQALIPGSSRRRWAWASSGSRRSTGSIQPRSKANGSLKCSGSASRSAHARPLSGRFRSRFPSQSKRASSPLLAKLLDGPSIRRPPGPACPALGQSWLARRGHRGWMSGGTCRRISSALRRRVGSDRTKRRQPLTGCYYTS